MRKVYDLAYRFPLQNRADSVYLAGAAVCGLLSGILSWRPHIWLTGDQASGKSSILTYFLNPLWAPAGGAMAEGRTSDAGIRQKLRRNAYPFIVDESEADTRADAERMEAIVSLARSSSSVSEGRTLKGTISGQGMEFLVRSVFALCSITHALEKPQDRQRFTILPCRMTDEHVAAWPDFKKELKATLTPEFALGFYARILGMVDIIMDNAAVFQKAIIAQLKCDARVGEHLGHLLAGACALLYEVQLSEAQATDFLKKMGALPIVDKAESNVPQTVLNLLYSFLLRDGVMAKSVGEHIEIMRMILPGFESTDASAIILKRYGLMYKDKALWVSSNHPLLVKLFKEAGITGHYGLLSLLEGAEPGHRAWFGMHQSRALKIPLPEKEK
jgi:putative DNA primase/helicase